MNFEISTARVQQITPELKTLPLEGLYLDHRLQEIAKKLKRPFIIANYISDENDVIATRDNRGNFQVAKEVKNPYDWRLFQELTAQADVILTGAGYLNRIVTNSREAQHIFSQFDRGGEFEMLGEWRTQNGFKSRNPDIVIVSRSLNFEIPNLVVKSDRKITIFTTYAKSESEEASKLKEDNVTVVGAGEKSVDGNEMITHLADEGYKVIKMTTGPRILSILLAAGVLDRLYITRVQINIRFEQRSEVQRILSKGRKVDNLPAFTLTHKYIQNGITTDAGLNTNQKFLVYDNDNFINANKYF